MAIYKFWSLSNKNYAKGTGNNLVKFLKTIYQNLIWLTKQHSGCLKTNVQSFNNPAFFISMYETLCCQTHGHRTNSTHFISVSSSLCTGIKNKMWSVILQLMKEDLLFNTLPTRPISRVGRVFTNRLVDLGSILGRVVPKTLEMVLDTSLLNTQQYKVHIKSKVEKSRE